MPVHQNTEGLPLNGLLPSEKKALTPRKNNCRPLPPIPNDKSKNSLAADGQKVAITTSHRPKLPAELRYKSAKDTVLNDALTSKDKLVVETKLSGDLALPLPPRRSAPIAVKKSFLNKSMRIGTEASSDKLRPVPIDHYPNLKHPSEEEYTYPSNNKGRKFKLKFHFNEIPAVNTLTKFIKRVARTIG